MLQTLHFNNHQCQRGGILWYTPNVPGPPNLIALATIQGIDTLYALFPCTPDGYRIEQPCPIDVEELEEERRKFTGN
jgi:hypothetical protein